MKTESEFQRLIGRRDRIMEELTEHIGDDLCRQLFGAMPNLARATICARTQLATAHPVERELFIQGMEFVTEIINPSMPMVSGPGLLALFEHGKGMISYEVQRLLKDYLEVTRAVLTSNDPQVHEYVMHATAMVAKEAAAAINSFADNSEPKISICTFGLSPCNCKLCQELGRASEVN